VEDFEKLGVFYLGRPYDLENKRPKAGAFLYDSRDLLTHAICVGMTGSGKTGLCISLLEEAAIDGIPVIAIDPKGDLSNLLLRFPNLSASEFLPWVNADDARKLAQSKEEFASQQAQRWKSGLEQFGQSAERIKLLSDAAEFAIYTPGSTAGLPISILKSLAPPADAAGDDSDLWRDSVNAGATSLLTLLGIEADPLQSRQHILLSNILNALWRQGQDLTLISLIQQIQNPPFSQIGAFDLESFFPAKERFALAMSLNNLLAAPGFQAWLQGDALDIDKILYGGQGKPRISVFSISHLSDSERMFFVTLLLNQIVTWMRAQSGTTSLRAIVFMDEIFGYFPPVAAPPSKAPLITLLKQARAFGVGVVLASQNPVDLDYKGLSNTGTWFIGRLQTERDKLRLLDGLEGAAATNGARFDRQQMDRLLASLGSRIFLMNNIHAENPEIFETRWTLSYLRGPMTRQQIAALMKPQKELASPPKPVKPEKPDLTPGAPSSAQPANRFNEVEPQSASVSSSSKAPSSDAGAVRPVLPPGISQFFLPVSGDRPSGARLLYSPIILASGTVRFADSKMQIETTQELTYLVPVTAQANPVSWSDSVRVRLGAGALEESPEKMACFATMPSPAALPANYKAWSKEFGNWLYETQKLWLLKSTLFGELSKPSEGEREFRIRLSQLAREERDRQSQKLRNKYGPKLSALQDHIRRAEQALELDSQAARDEQLNSAISVGATLLGAFTGRRRLSASTLERASSAARGVGRASRKQREASHSEENLQALTQQLLQVESEFKTELSHIERKFDAQSEPLETTAVLPKKSNITVKLLALAWVPNWQQQDGTVIPIWR
jgi:hypothetical protein